MKFKNFVHVCSGLKFFFLSFFATFWDFATKRGYIINIENETSFVLYSMFKPNIFEKKIKDIW